MFEKWRAAGKNAQKELEALERSLAGVRDNIQAVIRNGEEAKARAERDAQSLQSQKAIKQQSLDKVNQEFQSIKSELDLVSSQTDQLSKDLQELNAKRDAAKFESNALKREFEEAERQADKMMLEIRKLEMEAAQGIDDLRMKGSESGKSKKPQIEKLQQTSSEIMTKKDRLINRELIKSRAPKGKIYEPEVSSEYHCKCETF